METIPGWLRSEVDDTNSLLDLQNIPKRISTDVNTIRDEFRDYYVSPEGAIPWQNDIPWNLNKKSWGMYLNYFFSWLSSIMLSRTMYKFTRFEWETRDLQILYRDIRISVKNSRDCIATVAEHDQLHMFRDFVSKCVLGLRVWLVWNRSVVQNDLYVPTRV
jgi:hypothetical protein